MTITTFLTRFQVEGQTALHVAAIEGDETIVKILHVAKADANIPDNVSHPTSTTTQTSLNTPTKELKQSQTSWLFLLLLLLTVRWCG